MLSPAVSRQLKQVLEFYQRGVFSEEEFSRRLATLVTEENVAGMLDAVPAEAVPWLKKAVVEAAQDAVDAESLSPEESVFQENTVSAAYFLRVAEVLLERSAAQPRPNVTVVCLPSFEVEWALRIRGSAKIGFSAILTEPEEQIWGYRGPQSIGVRSKSKAIDTALGEAIADIWEKVLLRTRHPRRDRLGLDGVSYHFAYSGMTVGSLAGRTWSPARATIPGKLVAISHTLRAYLAADDANAEQARRELDSFIAEINASLGPSISPDHGAR